MDFNKLRSMSRTNRNALAKAKAAPKSGSTDYLDPNYASIAKNKNKMKPATKVGRGSEVVKYGRKEATEGVIMDPDMKKARSLMSPAKNREDGIQRIMKGMNISKAKATKMHDGVMKSYGFKPENTQVDELTLKKMAAYAKANMASAERNKNAAAAAKLRGDKAAYKTAQDKRFNRAKGGNMYTMKALGNYAKVPFSDVKPRSGRPANEEVQVEGYEAKVSKILNKKGIDHHWKNGKVYVAKRDVKKAEKKLSKKAGPGLGTAVRMIPDIVGEDVRFDLHIYEMTYEDIRNN